MHETPTAQQPARRRFLVDSLKGSAGALMLGLGLGGLARQSRALPASALRPPGAGAEADFLGACIRCGLCVRDCPWNILQLARWAEADAPALGTPWFEARTAPCEMCEDIPCIKACPTGALDHALVDIDQARMGLAALVDRETCLNVLGLRCDVCYRVCPLIDRAITLEPQHDVRSGHHTRFIPTVHSDACTGCGKCEHACVLEEAAIKVLPLRLAKGALGEHYRLGWEEKARSGESLVAPDPEHQYNLPEGVDYEHGGRGLMPEEQEESVPFSDDPLQTLNRGRGGL